MWPVATPGTSQVLLEGKSWAHVFGLQLQDGVSPQACPPAEKAY